ncbi:hypothetical protein TSAR_009177 [Trichomalopsis sarcophagae]|uniref:TNase-like domain-containing protein n=1 Tax=Trichomalopsis sarcophagae TaxID=543379 RepID=A0A232F6D2_9HYME|nr:hypothetical protein TSAR_009177 [Trichomalopsis sarcophagae]
MEDDKPSNLFDKFASFMEHDTRGEEFARFTSPSDVPRRFFKKKVLLEGVVKNVEPAEQPYLLVDHKPLVPLPRLGTPKYLPVKIAGVNVTGNGLSWLQAVVKGQKITLLPITVENQFLTCIVMVPQKDKETFSVGKELVKVGFGTVQEIPVSLEDKELKGYQRSLQLAQKWAERKRNGIWQFKYSPTLLWKLRNNLDNKLKSTLPVSLARYLNI